MGQSNYDEDMPYQILYSLRFCTIFLLVIAQFFAACGQDIPVHPSCTNPEFESKINQTINFTVPLIGVEELKDIQDEVYIFDTREIKEYNTSHIQGAQYLGYDHFNPEPLQNIPKNSPIVVYCSIGYRSEKIGEKLKNMGFTNVRNLYGSLFEWVNNGYPVINNKEIATDTIHTYNARWSKWVNGKRINKTW